MVYCPLLNYIPNTHWLWSHSFLWFILCLFPRLFLLPLQLAYIFYLAYLSLLLSTFISLFLAYFLFVFQIRLLSLRMSSVHSPPIITFFLQFSFFLKPPFVYLALLSRNERLTFVLSFLSFLFTLYSNTFPIPSTSPSPLFLAGKPTLHTLKAT